MTSQEPQAWPHPLGDINMKMAAKYFLAMKIASAQTHELA